MREPPKTTVVNIYKTLDYDVYIGRRGRGFDGYFGNPYRVGTSRVQSIDLYRDYFVKRMREDEEFARRINELQGKILGCFCKPLACHGDVIKEWLDGAGNHSGR